jgi:hypothetical protein
MNLDIALLRKYCINLLRIQTWEPGKRQTVSFMIGGLLRLSSSCSAQHEFG